MADPLALSAEPVTAPAIAPQSAQPAKATMKDVHPLLQPGFGTGVELPGAKELAPKSAADWIFTGLATIAPVAKLVPYIARLPLPLVRMTLGAITYGAESGIKEGDFAGGAKAGAIGAGVGEAIGAVGPSITRGIMNVPGMRTISGQAGAATARKAAESEATAVYGVARSQRTADVEAIKSKYQTDVEKRRETVTGLKDTYQADVATRRDKIKAQDEGYKQAWSEYRQAVDQYGQTVQGAESTAMARQVGDLIEKRVPTLGNRQTAEQLDALKQKGTKALVGEYFNNKVSEAQALTGGPDTTFRVPSLRRVPEASKINAGDAEAMDMLKETLIGPGGVKIHVSELKPTGAGAEDYLKMQEAAATAKEGRMTLSTIVDKLAALRLSAQVSNDPAVRTVAGKASRVKMQKALGEVQEELSSHDPAAWGAFHEGRKAYAFGSAMIDLFRRDGLFKRGADKVDLNPRALQSMVAKHRGWLEERMGTEDFREFTKTIQRGGELGPADVLAKKGQLPQFVGRSSVSVPPMPARPEAPPSVAKPTLPPQVGKPALPPRPAYQAPIAPSMNYPVDLTRAFIDSAVHRALP